MGVNVSTIRGWENSQYLPREGDRLTRLASSLNVDVTWLLGRSAAGGGGGVSASIVDTVNGFSELLVRQLREARSTVKDIRLCAPYLLPPHVQTEFRTQVSKRILNGTIEVHRAEIFYTLDRLKEVIANIHLYHGRPYFVRSYCAGLGEPPPAFGAYVFDDATMLIGAYWLAVPPHDRPGMLLRGPVVQTFFRGYWQEIWSRGAPLNNGGATDLTAVREVALKLGLPPSSWPAFLAEARALKSPDGAPFRI